MLKKFFLILVMLLFMAGVSFAGGTQTFEFFSHGTYTCPEEMPTAFFEQKARLIGRDVLIEDKVELLVFEQEFSGSPDTHLFIVTIVYHYHVADKCNFAILYVQTTTIKDGQKSDYVSYEYYDKLLYETGVPSKVLTKVDGKFSYEKFKAERQLASGKVEI